MKLPCPDDRVCFPPVPHFTAFSGTAAMFYVHSRQALAVQYAFRSVFSRALFPPSSLVGSVLWPINPEIRGEGCFCLKPLRHLSFALARSLGTPRLGHAALFAFTGWNSPWRLNSKLFGDGNKWKRNGEEGGAISFFLFCKGWWCDSSRNAMMPKDCRLSFEWRR